MNALIGVPLFVVGFIMTIIGTTGEEYLVVITSVGNFLLCMGAVMCGVWMYERRR